MNGTLSTGVRCGNRKAHGSDTVYHTDSAAVQACYAKSGRFTQTPAQAAAQNAAQTVARTITGDQLAQSAQIVHEADQFLPEVTVEQVVAQARARLDEQEREQARARRGRYLAWRSIPVGNGDRANYALNRNGSVVLYQVQRPSTGQYAGKTYVKRFSSDSLMKMGWEESGEVLDAIAADPMAAAVLYGRTAKRCAICHRALSDDVNKGADGLTSLQRGIGPVCMTKMRG